jgi:hypothetical protein
MLVAVSKSTFIRLVSAQGNLAILGEKLRVSKRMQFQYIPATSPGEPGSDGIP